MGRLEDIAAPNLSLRDAADDLEVHCRWGVRRSAQGDDWEQDPSLCSAIIKRTAAAAHEAACPFRVVACVHWDSGVHRSGGHLMCKYMGRLGNSTLFCKILN